ncbi:MAG: hypothetical protein SFX18_01350 [Pirellulales bacterium]|nr:hypothetical protein [Pirellulales bacterium]
MNTPLISITIDQREPYFPGETLLGEYQIDGARTEDLLAVELSVLWYTEGKGDEDLGVHFFERQNQETTFGESLGTMRRFSTVLPWSPLSYQGWLVKIVWCVRVRVFLRGGKDFFEELRFQLGMVPQPPALAMAAVSPEDLEGGSDAEDDTPS